MNRVSTAMSVARATRCPDEQGQHSCSTAGRCRRRTCKTGPLGHDQQTSVAGSSSWVSSVATTGAARGRPPQPKGRPPLGGHRDSGRLVNDMSWKIAAAQRERPAGARSHSSLSCIISFGDQANPRAAAVVVSVVVVGDDGSGGGGKGNGLQTTIKTDDRARARVANRKRATLPKTADRFVWGWLRKTRTHCLPKITTQHAGPSHSNSSRSSMIG
jgi:hypothetical protein